MCKLINPFIYDLEIPCGQREDGRILEIQIEAINYPAGCVSRGRHCWSLSFSTFTDNVVWEKYDSFGGEHPFATRDAAKVIIKADNYGVLARCRGEDSCWYIYMWIIGFGQTTRLAGGVNCYVQSGLFMERWPLIGLRLLALSGSFCDFKQFGVFH